MRAKPRHDGRRPCKRGEHAVQIHHAFSMEFYRKYRVNAVLVLEGRHITPPFAFCFLSCIAARPPALSQGMERRASPRGCSSSHLTLTSVPSNQLPSQLTMSSSRRHTTLENARRTKAPKRTNALIQECTRDTHIVHKMQ